jgi:hypothetical protein
MASSLVSALYLFVLALTLQRVISAPVAEVPENGEMPKFKILSFHSRQLVSTTPHGDVHAKAGDSSDPSTDFYQHSHGFPKVSYESVQQPGKYLVINQETGEIRVEVPEKDNEIFLKIAHPVVFGLFALKSYSSMDCYVAFDRFGSVPTDPGVCDPQLQTDIHTSVHVYHL